MQSETPGLFVVGTDTDVGKTFVAALIARKLRDQGRRVGVYKPVASGAVPGTAAWSERDAVQLWRAAGEPLHLDQVTPQHFSAPLAPPHAAAQAGQLVDPALLRQGLQAWRDFDCVIVEGAGGLLSPISEQDTVLDLAREFQLPLLIVVSNRLGCINHALLTVRAAQAEGLSIAGMVLNDSQASTDESGELNAATIEAFTNVRILERLPHAADCLKGDPQDWIFATR